MIGLTYHPRGSSGTRSPNKNELDTNQKPRKYRKPKARFPIKPSKIHKVRTDYNRAENKEIIKRELYSSTIDIERNSQVD